jgi:hypothetical protein
MNLGPETLKRHRSNAGLNWRSDVDISPTMIQEAIAKISAADFRLVPERSCSGGMSHIPLPSGSAPVYRFRRRLCMGT